MLNSVGKYAGRMAFSILCSMIGALVVSQLGLLQHRPPETLEKIVFNPAGLSAASESAHRVEDAHGAIRELLATQDAEARRQAAPSLEKDAVAPSHARASAQQERRKTAAPKRDLAAAPVTVAVAPPLVIVPVAAAQADAGTEVREDLFDRIAAGVTKLRKLIVETVRIETPLHLPFEGASASSTAVPLLDDLHQRLKLPSFGM
jgi:hypothetical protein